MLYSGSDRTAFFCFPALHSCFSALHVVFLCALTAFCCHPHIHISVVTLASRRLSSLLLLFCLLVALSSLSSCFCSLPSCFWPFSVGFLPAAGCFTRCCSALASDFCLPAFSLFLCSAILLDVSHISARSACLPAFSHISARLLAPALSTLFLFSFLEPAWHSFLLLLELNFFLRFELPSSDRASFFDLSFFLQIELLSFLSRCFVLLGVDSFG